MNESNDVRRVNVTSKKHMDMLLTKIPAWAQTRETAQARLAAAWWLGDLINGTDDIKGMRAIVADLKSAAVRDLLADGYQSKEIAKMVGCNPSRIHQLKVDIGDGWKNKK